MEENFDFEKATQRTKATVSAKPTVLGASIAYRDICNRQLSVSRSLLDR